MFVLLFVLSVWLLLRLVFSLLLLCVVLLLELLSAYALYHVLSASSSACSASAPYDYYVCDSSYVVSSLPASDYDYQVY